MKTQSILLAALASAPAVLAHTAFTDFFVDGMPQGDGVAMRMNKDQAHAGDPIASLDSDDMACNVGGTKGVSRVQPVPDGARLTFEIRAWPDDVTKERLDRPHYGPCAVYLKKVSSAIEDKGAGDGWFKIFHSGYDNSTERWCTDEIIDNNGLLSVDLPKGLEGGAYLARPEILALHLANTGDPQFYAGCAQIFLESSGNLGPGSTVSIPGHVSKEDAGLKINIYEDNLKDYNNKLPGPKIASLVAKSSAGTSSSVQTEGFKPEGCIVENDNWCGKEVPSYTDEQGCWAANADCYAQAKVCWSSALPTGGAGCKLWEKKCKEIETNCPSGPYPGPPNKGQVLTPKKEKIDVGKLLATVGGGIVGADAPSTPKTSKVEEKPAQSKTQAETKPTPAAEEDKSDAPVKATPAAEEDKSDAPVKATPAAEKASDASAPSTPTAAAPANSSATPTPAAPKPTPSNSYSVPQDDDEEDKPAPQKEGNNKPAPQHNNNYNNKPQKDNNYNNANKPQKHNTNYNKNAQKENNKNAAPLISTITVAPGAPKPTAGPACQPGYQCVTVTEVQTLTQTVYVTATAAAAEGYGYKRGVESFMARRRAHGHRM